MDFAGRLLMVVRALHGLRQADVAEAWSTSITRISRIEVGKVPMRDAERAALEELLHINVLELVGKK